MSTISRNHRIQLTIAATALVLALVGGIGSAFAQAAGGGGKGGGHGGSSNGGGPDPSAVIVYGTAGNCPLTVACAAPPPPPVVKPKRHDVCGDRRSYRDGRFVCRPDEI